MASTTSKKTKKCVNIELCLSNYDIVVNNVNRRLM